MEILFRIILFVTGVINLIPTLIAFAPSKIKSAYGVEIPDANYELLLRHRAVLFGLVGGLMIYAALTKMHYNLATLFGMISMVSFLGLYYTIDGSVNAPLTKVMQIDVGAIITLFIGFLLYKFFYECSNSIS